MSRFEGPRSSQCPWTGCVTAAPSRPGSASSAVRLSMLLVDPPFLRDLPWREPGERSGRDIIRDDRTRCNPSVVTDLHRSIERIVDTGPDVAPDPGLRLRFTGFVLEVRGDIPGGDVRVLADLGVPDVGEVRDLRAGADGRLLHLDEGADLCPLAENRARPDVGEGADLDAGRDPDVAPDDRERMDGDVRLDLDAGLDPRGAGIDDGDAGEHVHLVDPVAEGGRGGCQLDARVDPLHLERIGGKGDGHRN